ncbi:hypothetical protein Plhal703r1_c07g0039811 [Plasmopara halstedii]
MSPALKRGVHTPPGKYDQKKGKTGLVLYEGKGLPRLPGKRPNPRALAVYRRIGGAMINLQKLHQGKLSLRKAQNTKEMQEKSQGALLEEYQKLAGEVAIQGKDANPEIKTELRRVIVSMLACGLTSERK